MITWKEEEVDKGMMALGISSIVNLVTNKLLPQFLLTYFFLQKGVQGIQENIFLPFFYSS
jgi:hypothetical protein